MLPDFSPTFAAMARTRAASQAGAPGRAVPSGAEDAADSFADEVSGPAAAARKDGADGPESKAPDPAEEDRAEPDDLPQDDRPAPGEAAMAASPQPAAAGAGPGDATLTGGYLQASPALCARSGEIAADPLAAGPAGASAGLVPPPIRTPAPTGVLAAGVANAPRAAVAGPGEVPALRTAETARGDTDDDPAVDPDGAGPRSGTEAPRTAPGSPALTAPAGLAAGAATERAASDGPAPAPAAASPAPGPTTAPTTADPRTALAARASAPDGSDPGTDTDPLPLPDWTTGEPGAVAHPSGSDRGVAAPLDAPRSGEPRSGPAQALGSQIVDGIRQARDGSIEIALSPEELGSLKLTLAGDDSRLHVQIHAERPETEGLLRRHIALLQQDFRDLGYGHVSFDFGTRQDRPARFEAPAGDAGGSDDALDPVVAAAPTPRLAGLPAMTGRGLDLRL